LTNEGAAEGDLGAGSRQPTEVAKHYEHEYGKKNTNGRKGPHRYEDGHGCVI
jgi:hypothetical protein